MTTFTITNLTKNKVVLTKDFVDATEAAGKYISALFIAGLVIHCETDIEFKDDNHFRILSKGWDFEVKAV